MKVEVWSDVVCPFCYIGKRRFEKALASFEGRDDVEVVWRSFELDPEAPREFEGSLDEMLAGKYGFGIERARSMNEQVSRMAADEGLEYRLAEARPGNTFDAHRLIHLAARHGLHEQAKERLLQAYFSEGKPVGDRATLVQLAVELGLDEAEAKAALESGAFAHEVRADERRARQLGINGVPFFVIDGKYGVSGAQSAEVFEGALEKAWAERRPITLVDRSDPGASCEGESCDVGGSSEGVPLRD